MSTKYQNSKDVPVSVIISRLKELSDAITDGRESRDREFTMRIPDECDRDADLVLGEAASRLEQSEALNKRLAAALKEKMIFTEGAYVLRKQAEAVESVVGVSEISASLHAERLRQQADEAEQASAHSSE